ncbi:dynamin family protein, partial [Saccharomonospora iraqiensis]|uniref:dynamin family protein n=1 Tax=Saccharomonospora iraqiensis TaxID=52698 RepID=UPI0018DD2F56
MCLRLRSQVSPQTADGLTRVVRRLHAPLQVAVAGRLKSGKSTLVNALIGRRVAPTGVGECTRLVTRFRYGTVDRIEVVFRDGTTTALPFAPDGMIPADLGRDLDRVSHLEAYLTSAALRHMTVVDTPGLGSPDPGTASRAEDLLHLTRPAGVTPESTGDGGGDGGEGTGPDRSAGTDGPGELDATSRAAVTDAEAVLHVVTQTVRADDEQALAAF